MNAFDHDLSQPALATCCAVETMRQTMFLEYYTLSVPFVLGGSCILGNP